MSTLINEGIKSQIELHEKLWILEIWSSWIGECIHLLEGWNTLTPRTEDPGPIPLPGFPKDLFIWVFVYRVFYELINVGDIYVCHILTT